MARRYIILNTQAIANNVADNIHQKMLALFASKGFTVIGTAIVGRNLVSHQNEPDALTVTWGAPRQRITDNKWCVPYPDVHPLVFDDLTPKAQILAEMEAGSNWTVEEEQPTWWPVTPSTP